MLVFIITLSLDNSGRNYLMLDLHKAGDSKHGVKYKSREQYCNTNGRSGLRDCEN